MTLIDREHALRNLDTLSDEEADAQFMQWWPYHLLGEPSTEKPFVAAAGAHRARIQWRGASKRMVKASKAWLRSHGYFGAH
jgi:hypothetical protein